MRQELIDAVKAEILREGKYQKYLYEKMQVRDFGEAQSDVMTAIDAILRGVP
ncbi:hypothetical protein [Stutzerimonas stutzeri]|uniref:hypothetical protein n=1 Tax=Stutzerimonas stutzeri TaxID=316 RepID=UPI00210C2425|nr:hypothetical protein [Stutzerimonas stutzeri]MCQ4261091.1 hypothetical protein [Stutzerimonas stutzeri]